MEMKKKEKLKEQLITEQNEMLKAIKMQENMNKLNEFCKKNMMKNVHKKRNTTIQQVSKDVDKSHGAIKVISGRKLNFENSRVHE
jgi:L-lactate utilization protein LutC